MKFTLGWRTARLRIELPDRLFRRRTRLTPPPGPGTLVFADVPRVGLVARDTEAAAKFESFHHIAGRTSIDLGDPPDEQKIAAAARQIGWYHTIELPGFVTPGVFDHRPLVPYYEVPDDLRGRTVLDVGPADGFWSFEFERRGATVTALDLPSLSAHDLPPAVRAAMLDAGIDHPTGVGFELARAALRSNVARLEQSVYDIDPTRLGLFDIVHVGDMLLHLETPSSALRRLYSVTRGRLLLADCFDPDLRPSESVTRYLGGFANCAWWMPSLTTLAQMVQDAGFRNVTVRRVYRLRDVWRALITADR